MTEEITDFDFIDIFEGLTLHGIRESNLKFVGLHVEEMRKIRILKNDEFELIKKEFQHSNHSKEHSTIDLPSSKPPVSETDVTTAVNEGQDQAVNQQGLVQTGLKREHSAAHPYPLHTNQNLSRGCAGHSLSQFSNKSTDSALCPTSPMFEGFDSDQSFTQILSGPIEKDNLEAWSESSLHTNGQDSIVLKKPRFDLLESDDFKPISSELHILTSEL